MFTIMQVQAIDNWGNVYDTSAVEQYFFNKYLIEKEKQINTIKYKIKLQIE